MSKEKTNSKKTAKTSEEKKAERLERAKNRGPRQNYTEISSNDKNTRVRAMNIRGAGTLIETVIVDDKGKPMGPVSTVWVAGIKPKSKKEDKFLVIDKGPKPKKEKAEKEEGKKSSKK